MTRSIDVATLLGLSVLALALSLVLFVPTVESYNNQTVIARLNVTNTEPHLYAVNISPNPEIDLTPGNITVINCTGLVYDLNNWDDISSVNATLYDTTYGDGNETDGNYRYINNSCQSGCSDYLGSGTNASCTCQFEVEYYANNGTWECNMTIADGFGLVAYNTSPTVIVNPVVAIDVPDILDYGNLSVTETSSNNTLDIFNFGNVPINMTVRGWGGTETYEEAYNDTAMICDLGNISNYYQRYSANETIVFNDKVNLTNESIGIVDFNLWQRQDEAGYGNSTNTTYWQIYVPIGLAGGCNGTIEFNAGITSPI